MKIIEEQSLPGTIHLLLRIDTALEQSQGSELLRVQHDLFAVPNSPLGFSLRREHAAVILK